MHPRRLEIDAWLARPRISETHIANEHGLTRDSVRSHRKNHVPQCLTIFDTWNRTGRMRGPRLQVYEIVIDALDALAQGERAAWLAWTNGPAEHGATMAGIAHQIRKARNNLDRLARVAAEAAERDTESDALHDLTATVSEQLRQLRSELT
jgi:hypothetical protein